MRPVRIGQSTVRCHTLNRRNITRAVASLMLCPLLSAADSIEDVLARMDGAARQFKSYSAAVKQQEYTKAVHDTYESNGFMRFKRGKNGVEGILDLTSGPDRTVIHLNGSTVEVYLPKASTVEIYKAGQFASMLDQMLLLGFSVTRDEMKRDYEIKLDGMETVNSTPAARLVLTPKSAEALKYVVSIELWIPDGKGNAIRQRLNQPKGNYRMATFSDLRLNPPLPDSDFQLSLPKDVKRIKEN
ncbi:MAG TPA: outer membrane lipoprotein carrier protein LolA [Bryobacteraceae bacterium]